MTNLFEYLESPLLRDYKEKLAGALILHKNKDYCEILSAHTTKSMCIAYATEHVKKVCVENNQVFLMFKIICY